jgi:site-specific DNA-methyltransferase (adenine-specific)
MKVTEKINLYNCDNMEFMKNIPDKYYDLAIVDPPYGINADKHQLIETGGKAKAKKTQYHIGNWDSSAPEKHYFNELKRISKNQIIWGANHFIENIPNANSSCWIVWNKINGENNFADCELAHTTIKGSVRMFEFKWQGMLQGDMKNKEIRIHPTQKPVALYKWILDKYAKQGDKIFDSHLGSMSIAIACHDYGFELDGCELDTEYFEKGIQRVKSHISQLKLF